MRLEESCGLLDSVGWEGRSGIQCVVLPGHWLAAWMPVCLPAGMFAQLADGGWWMHPPSCSSGCTVPLQNTHRQHHTHPAAQSVASLCRAPVYEQGAPILVVAPTSVLSNWEREFDTWGHFRWAVLCNTGGGRAGDGLLGAGWQPAACGCRLQ